MKDAVQKYVDFAKSKDARAPNNHWYAGITNDLERRKKEHEIGKDIRCEYFESFFGAQKEDIAREIEQNLEKAGFVIYGEELDIVDKNSSKIIESSSFNSAPNNKKFVYILKLLANKRCFREDFTSSFL